MSKNIDVIVEARNEAFKSLKGAMSGFLFDLRAQKDIRAAADSVSDRIVQLAKEGKTSPPERRN